MIIIGYQGIGKSTLAGKNNIIDLESGNFWNNGKRPDDWYIYYCNIAEHLSQQGYIVFVSSHKVVRDRLRTYSEEPVYCIHPSPLLGEEWTKRLEDRYNETGLTKDFKAWKNAESLYFMNITELMNCGIAHYQIDSMDYDLQNIVNQIIAYDKGFGANLR